ncbi:MAG: amidohydrolase family protein, partial [Leifsonia sp.]
MKRVLAGARLLGRDSLVDITVDDERITAVAPAGAGAPIGERVELDGRVVVPGLWDNHVHFTQWTLTTRRLDLAAARSAAEVARLVAERIGSGDTDGIVGFGFRDGLWPDAPDRTTLDAVSGPAPVLLVSGDLHSAWLNSAALHAHGFDDHPTGLLREDDVFAVVRAIGDVPDAVLDGWAQEAAAAAAARGVVGIVDLEMTWNPDVWVRRIRGGVRSLRVEFGIYRQHLDDAIAAGLRTGDVVQGTDGLLRVGPFKII